MLLTEHHIEQYKRLGNPPQSLYNALIRQVQVNSMHRGRVFTVPEGGYMALAIYYYFLKQLDYSDKECMIEAGCTDTMIKRIQKYLDHLIRGDETARVHTKIKLVRNYMLLEQLRIPHELLIDVYSK
jgi:hypothetical protein|tara:strand:+ start:206 stop:586 length:381 start_codon:yes stop_codon:yes gene_type:complete